MTGSPAPKISVVVPCHNNGRFVAVAVESILAQSQPVNQIVFVDDRCSDNSVAEARRVSERITFVHGRFGSCAAARNAGLAVATGDLIAFLDADDAWPPESLAARVGVLNETNAGICYGRVRQTWLDVGAHAKPIGPEMIGRLAGSMLVKREVFDLVGEFDESYRVSEAIEWTARAVDAGISMAPCRELVLYRRVHERNTMRVTEGVGRLPLRALRSIVARRASAL